jgi:hypothetical protein
VKIEGKLGYFKSFKNTILYSILTYSILRFFVFFIDTCTDLNYSWLKIDKYVGNDQKQLFELFLDQNLLS